MACTSVPLHVVVPGPVESADMPSAMVPVNTITPIDAFVTAVMTGWGERHSGSALRIVTNDLDTNTDAPFALAAKREVERAFLAQPGVSLIERSDIAKIMDEQSFEASNFFSMSDIKPLRLEIADAVIYGLLEDKGGGKIRLTLSCLEYETARVLAQASFDLPSDFPGYADYLRRADMPLIPPQTPSVEEGALSVRLVWSPVRAYDAVYEVLRSGSYDIESLYSVVGRVSRDPKALLNTELEFVDKAVLENKEYFYRIRYISRGKASGMSGSVHAMPYSVPPSVAQMSGSWNYDMKAAIVIWKAPSQDVVLYEYEAVSGIKQFTGSVESPVLTLREYEPGKVLSVRVRAVSSRGIKGDFSPWMTIQVPPPAVSGVKAVQQENKVLLSWQYPDAMTDTAFGVYVANKDDVEFVLAGTTMKREFIYSGFSTGTTLRFYVKAVSHTGLEGPFSEIVSLKTYTSPPIPVISSAKVLSRFVLIEWRSEFFLDLRGYTLTVRDPDGLISVIYDGLAVTYTYSATQPGRYLFSVTCSNTRGQTSASASIEIMIPASALQ